MSPTPDSALADPQQIIADLQRANAELQRSLDESNAERDEALERETATAELLGIINSSPGELAPVFDAMLEKATRLCEATYGHLYTYDGQRYHPVAVHGEAQFVEWRLQRGPIEILVAGIEWQTVGTSGAPLERLVAGERVVVIDDAPSTEAYRASAGFRALVDASGIRSGVTVALRNDRALLGAITVYRQEVRPFSEREVALLENFAAQAVIAIENARLITETREALDQQTATAEVLQIINSSPGDLAPVFDAILEKAHSLCEASQGSLFLSHGEQFLPVAMRGVPEPFAERLRRGLQGSSQPLLAGERFVHIADMAASAHPGAQAAVELGGVRTLLSVPLRKGDALLGMIIAARTEVRSYSDKQIALLENFAAQAVIAMENARLIAETREALEQQTATAEVLGVINSSPGDLAPVFDAMLEKAVRLCEATHGHFFNYDGECFHLAAVNNNAPYVEWQRQRGAVRPLGDAPLGRISRGERIVHTADMREEEVYRTVPTFREQIDVRGVRSQIVLGLRQDNTLLGAMILYRQEVRPFTDKQIALLQNFAAQAVIAIENARLLTETREALEQQTATTEVLQVINSSTGDLAPVFDAMVEKAMRLCDAALGSLFTLTDGGLHQVAIHGTPELVALRRQEGPLRPQPGTPFYPLLIGEHVVHFTDLRESPAYRDFPAVRERVDAANARSFLAVALRRDEGLIGVLNVFRQEVRPFTEKEIALLQNFAAQAVIAMENARLITETREALEQQTATAEVLGVINASPGDLAPVFNVMLEKAMRLCGAAFGMMALDEGEQARTVAALGVPAEFAEFRNRNPMRPNQAGIRERLHSGESVVQIADMKDDDLYRSGDAHRRALVDLGGARTCLAVALRRDRDFLGGILIYRQEVRVFSDKQIALLQNFAAQAVIAMENARLIIETREALEQQTATAEVLGVINASPGDLAPVFGAMLDKAMRLCGGAFGLMIVSDGDEAPIVAARGVPAAFAEFRRKHPVSLVKGPFFSRLLAGEDFVHTIDLKDDDAYRRGDPLRRAIVDLGGGRTSLIVALRRDREVLGAIHIYRQELRPFTDKQIALLQNFAGQAVIAMENARLLGELRQRTDEVAELNRGLEARVAEQVDELGRVGRLKRFLAPQLAELIVSHGDEKILESHRREIVVVFCDLRGYTAFTETAEPEEVLDFLREYHGALGPLVSQFEGTLDQFSGDGIMVFFNDPVPIPDPAERAVKMAVAMREAAGTLTIAWRRRGRMLGFGAGIAQGYATLGQIGFADRSGYTAIGTVCNLAARLCAEAKDGQILVAQRVAVAVEETVPLEEVGELTVKGLTQPVVAYNVPLGAVQPALRVIEGGSPQTD